MTHRWKDFSVQTKSFILLFTIAVVGSYGCLLYTQHSTYNEKSALLMNSQDNGLKNLQTKIAPPQQHSPTEPEEVPVVTVDTTAWKRYENKTYNFSFLYSPTWKVSSLTKVNELPALTINTGKKNSPITLYISPTGYFAMEGLPLKQETINGQPAQDVQGLLYGIQGPKMFYTLNLGMSLNLKPEFQALVHSFTSTQ